MYQMGFTILMISYNVLDCYYIPEIWKFRWYYGFGCAAAAVSAVSAAVSAAAARQRLYRS